MVSNAFRIVLQVRTNSSRLPAKALLPLAGMPSALLVTSRASRLKDDFVVATSDNTSDDYLSRIIEEAGHRVIRGPLDDVLGRFVLATNDMEPNDWCVRITADNPFPDAEFIHHLVEKFAHSGLDYASSEDLFGQHLPYGLSAEIFTVSRLRAAHQNAHSASDREHVTPYIRRTSNVGKLERLESGTNNLPRCTLDTFEDYITLLEFFETVSDPVTVPWQELVNEFTAFLGRTTHNRVP